MKPILNRRFKAAGLFLAGLLIAFSASAAMQYSVAVRNARLDSVESTIGTSAILVIYDLTAGAPANCAAAITATTLATMTLPSDWMAAASSGTKAKSGTWQDTSADGTGTADFFRIFASDGTTCGIQGTVTASGGGGDLTLDNTSIAATQAVTVSTFTLTAGNP